MRRWIAVGLWIVAALAIIDTGISLALTCHEQGYQPGSGQNPVEDCSVFRGPIFGFLIWFANAFDDHGDAVIAVFTIVLAISTIGLWRSTRKLWEAGEKQIAVAAFAAQSSEQSARAAHRAAAIMDQTAERQLRAYVTLENGVIWLLARDEEIYFLITVRNFGPTPAYDFMLWCKADILPTDASPPFDQVSIATSKSVMGPTQPVDQRLVRKTSVAEISEIIARKKTIYFWGRADYVDAFGIRRWFVFRTSVNGPLVGLEWKKDRGEGWGLTPDPSGYDAN